MEKKVSDVSLEPTNELNYDLKPFALNYLENPKDLPVDYMETGTTVRDITQKDD